MASLTSINLNIFNAEQFKESVSQSTANTKLYLSFGRVEPWSNEAAPDQANTSVGTFNEVWNNMIGAKIITGNDIQHVVPRYDWNANTAYAEYYHCDCVNNLDNVRFYIVTTDWNVYKCLSNNSGALSTVMPTQTLTNATVKESDGYVWKYMYTISPAEQLKYTTNGFMPVKTLTADDNSLQWDVQQSAVSGGLESIRIANGGSNYNSNSISITITGDGSGANAYATINAVSNTISTIIIDSIGSGYTYATLNVAHPYGSNASLIGVISPPGGHGADPLHELQGRYLIIAPSIRADESGLLPVTNDYRQIALIRDPLKRGTSNVSTNTVIKQYTTLTLSGESLSEYIQDETVYQSTIFGSATFTGKVIEYDDANNSIKLTNTTGIPTEDLLIGLTSTASKFVDSITYPDLEKYSGELLYIDNISAIERAPDQTESFKVIIKF